MRFYRRDLLDISPVLTEAAGAIVDVSALFDPFTFSRFLWECMRSVVVSRLMVCKV